MKSSETFGETIKEGYTFSDESIMLGSAMCDGKLVAESKSNP